VANGTAVALQSSGCLCRTYRTGCQLSRCSQMTC